MAILEKKAVVRTVVFALVLIFIIPMNAVAVTSEATEPRASSYLTSYNTYIYPESFGKMQVWFSVTGTNYMDEIGALSVAVYESTDGKNWSWVKTYTHDTASGMMGYDKVYYSGHVDHQGTIGRYYKAYVCIWAGKNGDGDARYMWTDIQKASLFAG